MSSTRQHVHELIDRLPERQLAVVEGLLESFFDPVARALAAAPFDDEPVTEEDRRRLSVAQADANVPIEEVLAEFGMKLEDFSR